MGVRQLYIRDRGRRVTHACDFVAVDRHGFPRTQTERRAPDGALRIRIGKSVEIARQHGDAKRGGRIANRLRAQ